MALPQEALKQPEAEQKHAAPAISLPKGGGAIRGVGEKFAANPVTGTGSMTVPLAISPGRSGFAPQLSLSYDSGSGNGPFGLGWQLSVPIITRKTDKGLPQYHDAEESDVYILSGVEDLVPVLRQDGTRFKDDTTAPGYVIHRYRPRIEGLFARIERWTKVATGEIHWRSISRDNITTLYGTSDDSRIFDPADSDPLHPTRIFSWLICQSYDDKGNAIVYQYQQEDSDRIFENENGEVVALAHERNRTQTIRSANRYLKYIRYGNRQPNRDLVTWHASDPSQLPNDTWMFEVVFDYGDGHYTEEAPDAQGQVFVQGRIDPPPESHWPVRKDPISSYRAGFEVRTYRVCRRVLMFHHFPQELGIIDCLVRSTEFSYAESPIASFITSVTQSGYVRQPTQNQPNRYLKKSLPPLEFGYSQVPTGGQLAQLPIRDVDTESLENLPIGLDGVGYQWMDLDGEGTFGVLTEQADGWYYKRNLSANNVIFEEGSQHSVAHLGATEVVVRKPNLDLVDGGQFLDLAGDGQVDLVQMEPSLRGFYERTDEANWLPFRPFASWPDLNTHDPDLKFVDLTGDGHADILITEGDVMTWYPSLAEEGFGPALQVNLQWDEEKGPLLVFADATDSVYLADLSGDGLSDLVRIRNGEVCYWPNLGYGRFGPKVTMDNAPWFDNPDQFDPRRIRLADTDGSGTTDIFYLRRDDVQIYFNQSGNRWSDEVALPQFPASDNISSVQALDLLGNGTACLVWSSPLPGAVRRPMRYLALMEEKPHLLIGVKNNLGAETKVHYAPSTKFYLDDKEAGKPWITRLPFPVHVVERVETFDYISRNYFVSRYAYHHGYFDGEEREFRGFGMVEQWDTDEFNVLDQAAANVNTSWHMPPVYTKTWFHTGAYFRGQEISLHLAHEYYGAPKDKTGFETWAKENLVNDTVLPDVSLDADETRQACRALKGAMLRQEVYADDDDDSLQANVPYTVAEQNFTIELLQQQASNRHAVFFTHARESVSYQYERNPADARVSHVLNLQVDNYGNVLKTVSISYGRRKGQSPLQGNDKAKQEQLLITYTENDVTDPIDGPDDYRSPMPYEARTYEITGLTPTEGGVRFSFQDFAENNFQSLLTLPEIAYEQTTDLTKKQTRLIEHVRTLYRKNDLAGFSPLGKVESLALPGESYKFALTPNLLKTIFIDTSKLSSSEVDNVLGVEGGYVHSEGDAGWWIPSGNVFYSPTTNYSAASELAFARSHFFLAHRFRDPFGNEVFVTYDGDATMPSQNHNLLLVETKDALGNVVTVRTQDDNGNLALRNDYRVLRPYWVTDPNGNRAQVSFDALGMVVATASMGKPGENKGDNFSSFETDLTQTKIDALRDSNDPHALAAALLKNASTRIIYDVHRFSSSKKAHPEDSSQWEPSYAATLTRETHVSDPLPPQGLKIQISFSYSDGFGREIQKKIQAEPGEVEVENTAGGITVVDTTPKLRWVGSGWTIFNNKGKPVRQYEPFFSTHHHFEFGNNVGVSPTLFYDPVERVVATLHPNHVWEKVVFDPWQQTTFDVNDTVTFDPKTEADVSAFFKRLPDEDYMPTWYQQRVNGGMGTEEKSAADKAALHADTPAVNHFDSLGRTFLTIAHNKFVRDNTLIEEKYSTRVVYDIEGNQREVIDAKDRVVMRYDYDMLGNRIHLVSMEAGERWMLNDVAGKPLYTWDSRNHEFSTSYDMLRRPTKSFLREGAGEKLLLGRTVYGESQVSAEANNLRRRVVQVFDQAGVVTSDSYDFKGNPLRNQRQLAKEYKAKVDWSGVVPLEEETFTSSTTYDALNRPTQLIAPHSDQSGATTNIIQPIYNEANLLEETHVWLKQPAAPTHLLDASTANLRAVANIDYNAKGQRTLLEYGNGVRTTYTYDPLTFHLSKLKTTHSGATLQDLSYTYDPGSNITHLRDDAQQTIFFNNSVVEPHCDFNYDAIYRLIEARGREHIGQSSKPVPMTWNDEFRTNLPHPGDGQAMRNYGQRYEYDEVGNFSKLIHEAVEGSWRRTYDYQEASQIEPARMSNRLTRTTVGSETVGFETESYTYDAHGSMINMSHLPTMQWDFHDQLQQVDLLGGGMAYYVYGAAGQRVRRIREHNGGTVEERIYLGGFEIYRKRNGSGPQLERETLHLTDDQKRIVLVETLTKGTDGSPPQLVRYQLDNHLGSSCLELNQQGKIISYEEYYPYGSTSYQAVRKDIQVPLKRYRFTGKERDEETGFNYHGARYYVAWLGRWTSADPGGLTDSVNLYAYVSGSPQLFTDGTGRQGEPVEPKKKKWEQVKKDPKVVDKEGLTTQGKKKIDPGRTVYTRRGFGGSLPYRQQGHVHRPPGGGKAFSLFEHVWPRAHQKLLTGVSVPMGGENYRGQTTLTVPAKVAAEKTKLDNQVTNRAKRELKIQGKISDKTMAELQPEGGLDRLMQARNRVNMQAAFSREDVERAVIDQVRDFEANRKSAETQVKTSSAKPAAEPAKNASVSGEPIKGPASGERGSASVEAMGGAALAAGTALLFLQDLSRARTSEERHQVLAGWLASIAFSELAYAAMGWASAGLMTSGDQPIENEEPSSAPQLLDIPSSPPPTSVVPAEGTW